MKYEHGTWFVQTDYINFNTNTVVPCKPAAWVDVPKDVPQAPAKCNGSLAERLKASKISKKKEDTMSRYYDEDLDMYIETSNISDAEKQRMYLKGRVTDISSDKHDEMHKQFGLSDDESPSTFEEFIARITAGKYQLRTGYKADQPLYNPGSYIRWRDPSVEEDRKGFDAAMEAFAKAKTDTIDTIVVSDAVAGLAAVKALEAWTPAKAS